MLLIFFLCPDKKAKLMNEIGRPSLVTIQLHNYCHSTQCMHGLMQHLKKYAFKVQIIRTELEE